MENLKHALLLIFFASFFISATETHSNKIYIKTVYFFWAENCSACKEAHSFYKKPAGIKDGSSWNYNNIKFISYRIVDENNRTIPANMNKINNMCSDIAKKTGNGNFVHFRRDIYEYYKNKNLPYYRKEEKYSRKDEPFPTPVFITGDRVILGFNNDLLQRAVEAAR